VDRCRVCCGCCYCRLCAALARHEEESAQVSEARSGSARSCLLCHTSPVFVLMCPRTCLVSLCVLFFGVFWCFE
jgi:hypothetical protein